MAAAVSGLAWVPPKLFSRVSLVLCSDAIKKKNTDLRGNLQYLCSYYFLIKNRYNVGK